MLHHIVDLPSLLQAGDLLVVNNSRVLPARLCGQTANGGRVEVLAERFLDDGSVLAQVKAANAPKPNAHLVLAGGDFIVKRRAGEFFILFAVDGFARQRFLRYGQIPLPPYIRRTPDDQDKARYQTVFAYRNGSVAARDGGITFYFVFVSRRCRAGCSPCHCNLTCRRRHFQTIAYGASHGKFAS